jgi:hypothetical protein
MDKDSGINPRFSACNGASCQDMPSGPAGTSYGLIAFCSLFEVGLEQIASVIEQGGLGMVIFFLTFESIRHNLAYGLSRLPSGRSAMCCISLSHAQCVRHCTRAAQLPFPMETNKTAVSFVSS